MGILDAPARLTTIPLLGVGDGTTDDTAAINAQLAAAAAGSVMRGVPGKNYLISAPLVTRPGGQQTLDMTGCTITLKANSNCNLLNNGAVTAQRTVSDGAMTSGSTTLTSATAAFTSADVGRSVTVAGATAGGYLLCTTIASVTNSTTAALALAAGTTVSAATVAIYNRDSQVTVIGGTWARGSNAGSQSATHNLRFRHVDGLRVRDLRITSSAGKYAISIGDATNVRVGGLDLAVFSDGVHLTGPLTGAVVRDISGSTGDDVVAITPQDWANYADTLGPVSDVVIENLEATTNAAQLILLGGAAGSLSRVRARNIGGSTTNASRGAVLIGNDSGDPGTATGSVDDITVENVTTRITNSANCVIRIYAGSGGTIRLRGLTHNNTGGLSRIVNIISGTVVAALSVEGVRATPNTSTDGIWVNGTINDLVVRDWQSAITGYVVRLDDATSSARVDRLTMSDVHLTLPSTNGGYIRAQLSGHTLPVAALTNCVADKTAWIADVGCTIAFLLSNVRTTNSGSGIMNLRSTAVATIRGGGNDLSAGASGVVLAAGAVANCYTLGFPCDVNSLTKVANGMAFNTNGARSCGAGPITCDGTNWKHIFTAATF